MSLTSGREAAAAATIAHRPALDPTPAAERDMRAATATFGQAWTDNMVTIHWDTERRWHQAELLPLRPFEMHPASAGLH
ncbi:MAG TPA: hypothetical protein VFY84_02395 [Jiangellales bacterium]|nr:hypothetical protein [Jiangellales bacterium]